MIGDASCRPRGDDVRIRTGSRAGADRHGIARFMLVSRWFGSLIRNQLLKEMKCQARISMKSIDLVIKIIQA